MKMKVAYLRVSSEEQREKQTIETQRTEVAKACEARGVKLDKIYQDDGVSGTIPLHKRPDGRLLLEEAAASRIGEVYIWKYDRLGRNLRDFLNLNHKLDKLGVHVESVTQPVPEGPAGKLMMQMLGAFAELDRSNILENTRRGLAGKAERGGWTGGHVPFGYRVEGVKRDARLVTHQANADLVRRIFEDAAAGKSCQWIADWLNAEGVPPSKQNLTGAISAPINVKGEKRESIWRPTSVRVILTNATYTGTRQWGRRQWVKVEDDDGTETVHLKTTPERIIEAPVPAVVDEELWRRANAALPANQILAMAHPKTSYLLRGLMKCALCGHRFTGRGYCYSCIGRHCSRRLYGKGKKPCAAPLVRRSGVEGAVWDICEAYISHPEEAAAELEREMEAETEPARKAAGELKKEENRLAGNTQARDRARMQNQDGWSTRTEFEKDMRRLAEQRSAIEARIAELRTRAADHEARAEARGMVRSVLEEIRASLIGGYTEEQKHRIVEALIERVTVFPDGEYEIKVRFHSDLLQWLRAALKAKFSASGEYHGPPATKAEVHAGTEALRVALEATPARCGSTNCVARATNTRRLRSNSRGLRSSWTLLRSPWREPRSSM